MYWAKINDEGDLLYTPFPNGDKITNAMMWVENYLIENYDAVYIYWEQTIAINIHRYGNTAQQKAGWIVRSYDTMNGNVLIDGNNEFAVTHDGYY